MSARRDNQGKVQYSLLLDFPNALEGATRCLEYGSGKYGRTNWQKGLAYSAIMDSLLRHLVAFAGGEDNDPESTLPHVDHIVCNAALLAEMVRIHIEQDDRQGNKGARVRLDLTGFGVAGGGGDGSGPIPNKREILWPLPPDYQHVPLRKWWYQSGGNDSIEEPFPRDPASPTTVVSEGTPE